MNFGGVRCGNWASPSNPPRTPPLQCSHWEHTIPIRNNKFPTGLHTEPIMADIPQLNASFSTLLLMVIKDLRIERGIPQGALAASAGKTPSAWTKIESGASVLTVDTLFGVCPALALTPSYVATLAERLIPLFNARGWYFSTHSLNNGEDNLLPLIAKFYASQGQGQEQLQQAPYTRVSMTAIGNPYSPQAIPTIVEYCRNPEYRAWFDSAAKNA